MLTKAEYWERQFLDLVDAIDIWLDNAEAVKKGFDEKVVRYATEILTTTDIRKALPSFEQLAKFTAGSQTIEVARNGLGELLSNAEKNAYENLDLEGNDEFGL